MRGLKILKIGVIAAGAAIVAGTVALIVAAGDRLSRGGGASGTVSVDLPAGASVEDAVPDGDRILVRLRLADGAVRLVLIDAGSGLRRRVIDLKAPR